MLVYVLHRRPDLTEAALVAMGLCTRWERTSVVLPVIADGFVMTFLDKIPGWRGQTSHRPGAPSCILPH